MIINYPNNGSPQTRIPESVRDCMDYSGRIGNVEPKCVIPNVIAKHVHMTSGGPPMFLHLKVVSRGVGGAIVRTVSLSFRSLENAIKNNR